MQKTKVDKGVLSLFEEAMGMKGGAPTRIPVIAPKFDRLNKECDRFVKGVELLSTSGLIRDGLAHAGEDGKRLGIDALAENAIELRRVFQSTFGAVPDITKWRVTEDVYNYEAIPKDLQEGFVAAYGRHIRQENPLVQIAVTTCKNLTPYKESLKDVGALSDRFLLDAGQRIAPIDGCPEFNLKGLYITINGAHLRAQSAGAPEKISALAQAKKMILMCTHKMYAIAHAIYEGFLMPDIDPEQFTEVIAASIDKVEAQIPRCREAFAQIRKSTGLLKSNFTGYYHDYAASNDPTIILQNYVVDVSKSTGGSPKIARQFRQIIAHYRKLAGAKANDPRISSLIGSVDKSFQAMERADRRAGSSPADEPAPADSSPAADEPAPADSSPADGGPPAGGAGTGSPTEPPAKATPAPAE